jgi:hypothetical protein
VVIVVSLIKIARPQMKILNVFANMLLLAIAHLTLAFLKVLARRGAGISIIGGADIHIFVFCPINFF